MQHFTPFRGKKRDAMPQDRREMSDLGHKRKWCHARVMSVLPPCCALVQRGNASRSRDRPAFVTPRKPSFSSGRRFRVEVLRSMPKALHHYPGAARHQRARGHRQHGRPYPVQIRAPSCLQHEVVDRLRTCFVEAASGADSPFPTAAPWIEETSVPIAIDPTDAERLRRRIAGRQRRRELLA
jgi:hypothetical protein